MKLFLSLSVIVFLVMSCETPKPVTSILPESGGSEKLFASKWSLREVEGLMLMPSTVGKEAYLLFFPGQISKVSGSTGCNKLQGTFEISVGHKMQFSPIVTTKMMCPPDGNNTEQRFLSVLSKVDNYHVSEESLLLRSGEEVMARLAATPADQPNGK